METTEGENSSRWLMRRVCLIMYLIILELVGIACLGLAVFSFTSNRMDKLRIWDQFDYNIDNLVPLMSIGAAVLTILTPIPAVLGIIKRSQILLMVFCVLVTSAAFAWFGIGAWCASLHQLILSDIPVIFTRLFQDGKDVSSDAFQFLQDLREYMPLINNRMNFKCCQSTPDSALIHCADECEERYLELFQTLIFPSLFSFLFGAGFLCLLSVICSCALSCHLDDVKPAF